MKCAVPSLSGESSSGEQQISYIRTRDQKHERDGCEKNPESGTDVSDDLIQQRLDSYRDSLILSGILPFQTAGDDIQVSACLRDGGGRFKPSDDPQHVPVALVRINSETNQNQKRRLS